MEYHLKISLRARRDFNSIERYISPDDPAAITEFSERLLERAQSLTTFPLRHGEVTERPNIRKVPFRSYLIYYRIREDKRRVEILRFYHAARDQTKLRLREETGIHYGGKNQPAKLEA